MGSHHKADVYSGKDGSLLWEFSIQHRDYLEVSGAGDVNGDGFDDVIIGAPYIPVDLHGDAGSAIVCSGKDGTVLWRVDGTAASERLGRSVDGVGDVNQDGFDDVIVGASREAVSGSAVVSYVYSGQDGALIWQLSSYRLGGVVAGAGDVNGDGVADVILGAPSAQPNGIDYGGSAFVYSGKDAALLWRFDGVSEFDQLGAGVAGAGDVDRDGHDDLIVNVTANESAGVAKGSAIVYSGRTGKVLWQIGGDDWGDWWGFAVDGAGDVNGDGFADLVVGAPRADPGRVGDAGSAFVYTSRPAPLMWYGSGIGGSGGFVPQIGTGGQVPWIANPAFEIQITGGRGGSVAAIAGSLAVANTSVAGLTFYGDFLDPQNFILWPFLTTGQPGVPGVGTAVLPVPIPNDPALLAFTTFWQGFVMDPESPAAVEVTQTAGLRVTLVQ